MKSFELELENDPKPMNSFDVLTPPQAKPKKQYKIKEVIIDKVTTLRTRVEITPSMCLRPRCNFDVAITNNYPSWDKVPESKRGPLLQALKEHDAFVHSNNTDDIIDEDQLGTEWLGISPSGMQF